MADFKFSRNVSTIAHGRCHPGDVKSLDDDVAARYEKRGWGEVVKPPARKKPATKKEG